MIVRILVNLDIISYTLQAEVVYKHSLTHIISF